MGHSGLSLKFPQRGLCREGYVEEEDVEEDKDKVRSGGFINKDIGYRLA